MDIDRLLVEYPAMQSMSQCKEILWLNEKLGQEAELPFDMQDIEDAERRLTRFAAYLKTAFPETEENDGIIESPLTEITKMKKQLEEDFQCEIPGRLFLKCDSHLAVSYILRAGAVWNIV